MVALSLPILEEYRRVGAEFLRVRSDSELDEILGQLVAIGLLVDPPCLPEPLCRDRDDDKFISCALAAEADAIVSGDKDLLAVSGQRGIPVVTPRQFLTLSWNLP